MCQQVLIGLLSPYLAPFRAYEQAGLTQNVSLAVVTPERINWQSRSVNALVWDYTKWHKKTVPLPRSLYNRFYGPKPQIISALEQILGANKIFNHITRFDKWEMHNIFSQTELATTLPTTCRYSPIFLADYLKKFPSVIIKPQRGHLGLDIFLISQTKGEYHLHRGSKYPISSYNTLASLVRRLHQELHGDFLLQQFINLARIQDRIFDVRCLLQKDDNAEWKVTGLLSRVALSYSYSTNMCHKVLDGHKALQQSFPELNLISQIETLSIKGAQIAEQSLGSLGELSIDLALDEQGKIWIIELNGKPMKGLFRELDDAQIGATVFEAPIAYARSLATT